MYAAGAERGARSAIAAPPPSLIDEIEFHLATDPTVRDAFLVAGGAAAAPAVRAKQSAAKRSSRRAGMAKADPRAALRMRASAVLRAVMTEN